MANTPVTSFRLSERVLEALDQLVWITTERDRELWADTPKHLTGDYTRSEVLSFTILRQLDWMKDPEEAVQFWKRQKARART